MSLSVDFIPSMGHKLPFDIQVWISKIKKRESKGNHVPTLKSTKIPTKSSMISDALLKHMFFTIIITIKIYNY